MKTLPLEVGERIRARRIAVGLTQGCLARQAGVSRRHLAALEKGANVSTLVLAKVGNVLDYSLSELFREELLGAADASTQRYGSVFISYGTPDEDVARRIFQDLPLWIPVWFPS